MRRSRSRSSAACRGGCRRRCGRVGAARVLRTGAGSVRPSRRDRRPPRCRTHHGRGAGPPRFTIHVSLHPMAASPPAFRLPPLATIMSHVLYEIYCNVTDRTGLCGRPEHHEMGVMEVETMLMRTDPFRDLDRLTQQIWGTQGDPRDAGPARRHADGRLARRRHLPCRVRPARRQPFDRPGRGTQRGHRQGRTAATGRRRRTLGGRTSPEGVFSGQAGPRATTWIPTTSPPATRRRAEPGDPGGRGRQAPQDHGQQQRAGPPGHQRLDHRPW